MAKIIEEHIVIKISTLVKSSNDTATVVTPEIIQALEQVVQELVGESHVVELESAA